MSSAEPVMGLIWRLGRSTPEVVCERDGRLVVAPIVSVTNCARSSPQSLSTLTRGPIVAFGLARRCGLEDELAAALNAYFAFGPRFAAELRGPFSIAVWDKRINRLVCARDRAGQYPAFYHRRGGISWSPYRRVVVDTLGQRIPTQLAIAEFLTGQYVSDSAGEYAELERLPPAHQLSVESAGTIVRTRFWKISRGVAPSQPLKEFRQRLNSAVARVIDAPNNVAATLSGGLDSSSIACVWRSIAGVNASLASVSKVFDKTPRWNERDYIESVAAHARIDAHFYPSDGYSAFEDFDAALAEQDAPFVATGLPLSRKLYRFAADRGYMTLLDGHGGDEVISYGHERLVELARARDWRTLWRECVGAARIDGSAATTTFARYALNASWRLRQMQRRIRSFASALQGRGRLQIALGRQSHFVQRDFLQSCGLEAELHSQAAAPFHLSTLTAPLQGRAMETLFYASHAQGIDLRFPYWDEDLVDLCVSLPARAQLRGGYSRLLLRRAMKGLMPENVRRRVSKFDFAPHVARSISGPNGALVDAVLAGEIFDINDYVDVQYVRAAHARLLARKEAAHGTDVRAIWRAVSLALWLRRTAELNTAPSRFISRATLQGAQPL